MDATGAPEFAAIDRIERRLLATGGAAPAGELWIGDDAAVVRVGDASIVMAADALVVGVHADLTLTTLADLGWKALAVNVSDLAAMGCRATRAVVTVSAPAPADVDALYEGLAEASQAFDCRIVGGDLTSSPTVVVSVTVVGDAALAPPPVTRYGANPGDEVWTSGPLGSAAAGLRLLRAGRRPPPGLFDAHARPTPRTREGQAARELGATAMIDVSDGFLADLGHILDRSAVGVELDTVPVAAGATLEDALQGGDDYELVWCARPGSAMAAGFSGRALREPHLLGRIVADRLTRTLEGRRVTASGWDHWR